MSSDNFWATKFASLRYAVAWLGYAAALYLRRGAFAGDEASTASLATTRKPARRPTRATTAPAELRDALVRQVSAPVRWVESMQLLMSHGVDTFVEVGPGEVLSGLMRRISRDVKMLNVEDAASLQKIE